MAKIKGQNLRLFLGGKCVAAATSCTLHVAANVEDCSTKDTVGGWTENTVVGFSWDAACDALVTNVAGDAPASETLSVAATATGKFSGTTCYYDPKAIPVTSGDIVIIDSTAGEYAMAILTPDGNELAEASAGQSQLRIVIDDTMDVSGGILIGNESYEFSGNVTVTIERGTGSTDGLLLSDVVTDMLKGKLVYAEVDLTTEGVNSNRTKAAHKASGYAHITDISLNAGNHASSTYTTQLTGSGTLIA